MIRDEFKNVDKKVINKKANKKLQEMGERAYYAKKLSFLNEVIKPTKFSTLFTTIPFLFFSALYLLSIILAPEKKVETPAIVVFCITGALVIWSVVWFAYLAPTIRKKIAFYKEELNRLNREYVSKYVRKG